MEPSIRIAQDGDLAALTELRRVWNEENAGGPIDDPGFADAFVEWWEHERDTRTFFLVALDDLPVGMANVKRYQRMPTAGRPASDWGYVGNVFVRIEHRNAGVGETLMRHIVAWARAEQLAHLRLAPSSRSATFYERLGFLPGIVVEFDPADS